MDMESEPLPWLIGAGLGLLSQAAIFLADRRRNRKIQDAGFDPDSPVDRMLIAVREQPIHEARGRSAVAELVVALALGAVALGNHTGPVHFIAAITSTTAFVRSAIDGIGFAITEYRHRTGR